MDAPAWSNLIAALALLVSIAAAGFSWRSASQAKLANNIAIHQYQKELHQAFFEVRKLLSGRGLLLKQLELRPYGMMFKTSPLYVSATLSKQLLDFYDECFKVEDLHSCLEMNRDYSRLMANEAVGLEGSDLAEHRANAEAAVIDARTNLLAGVMKASEMARKVERQFISEIKLR